MKFIIIGAISLLYKTFALISVLSAGPAAAQTGLLVVAHGADSEWNAQVRQTVEQLRWEGPRAVAFLMGPERDSAGWDAAVLALTEAGAQRIVVAPLMVSSHGSHYRQILHYAGLLAELPAELASHAHHTASSPVPMLVTPALDAAPELSEALATRWAEMAPALRAAPLLLLAHGPNDDGDAERWTSALGTVLARATRTAPPPMSGVALLRDDAPAPVRAAAVAALRDTVIAWAAAFGDSVTVTTALVATGAMTRTRIPADLSGLPVRYTPAGLTPLPVIARWIERVAGAALAQGAMP